MLFKQEFWPGIRDGTVTAAIRRWKRSQAVAGNRYRTPAGIIEALAVDVIGEDEITDGDAVAAGFVDAAEVIGQLRGTPDLPIYRVRFRFVDEPDPRTVLANDDQLDAAAIADISARLDRMDRSASGGPWTHQTLLLIRDHPEQRAPDLAEMVGRDTQPFKRDVRKLKNMGLTHSFNPGYRLSPRGEAFLEAVGD